MENLYVINIKKKTLYVMCITKGTQVNQNEKNIPKRYIETNNKE